MKIIASSSNRSFAIEEDNQTLVKVKYKNWLSSTATTEFENSTIEIKPKSFWHNKYLIFKNQQEKGEITRNWKGQFIISLAKDEFEKEEYLFKTKGFWKQKFTLIDKKENVVFVLCPSFSWWRLAYNYTIEQTSKTYTKYTLIELLIYCGFSTNKIMSARAAAAS